MSNLQWFIVLYGLSCIPWVLAYRIKNRDAQWGLFLIDLALTIPAWFYCWWAIGWWSVVLAIGLSGFGKLIESRWGKGYDNLSDEQRKKLMDKRKKKVDTFYYP